MAPKRPLGNPPPASSEDEDEEEEDPSEEEIEETQEEDVEEGEEEEEEEDEDEEDEEPVVKQSIVTTQASKPEEESESESESSSDSNASDLKTNKHVKQIALEPKIATPELSTPISKKRAAETPKSAEASSKRPKGAVTAASFQRIWSDEDVIAILEAMIRFKEEKGAEPSPTEMAEFYESIKGVIHIQVSKNQLSDKIRTLRKKYQNNAKRGQDGEDPVFSKPHEHKTFQLSKLIWGDASTNGAVVESAKKSNKKSKAPPAKKEEQSFEELLTAKVNGDEFWNAYPSLSNARELMHPEVSASMGLVRRSKVKEMDEKWHKLHKKQFDLSMKKAQLFLDVSHAMGFGKGN